MSQKGPEDFAPDDYRREIPRFSKENFPNILRVADGLKKIGEKYGATAGQVALAWVLAQGEDIVPIVGTTKVKVCYRLPSHFLPPTDASGLQYLDENLGALKVKLTPEELQEVRAISEKANAAQGDRYPPDFMQVQFGDTPSL